MDILCLSNIINHNIYYNILIVIKKIFQYFTFEPSLIHDKSKYSKVKLNSYQCKKKKIKLYNVLMFPHN